LPRSSITISSIAGEAGVVGIYVGMRGALMILSKEIQTSKDLLRCPLAHHFLTIFNISLAKQRCFARGRICCRRS
jgi:hypothetical protein